LGEGSAILTNVNQLVQNLVHKTVSQEALGDKFVLWLVHGHL